MSSLIKYSAGIVLLFTSFFSFGQLDTTWIKTYGGNRDDKAFDIIHTQDSGYLIIGSTGSFDFDNSQMYFLKLDSTGAIQWSKSHGGTNQEAGHAVIQTQDGGFLGVGFTNSWGAGGFDLLLVKLDSNGTTEYERYFGGVDWDFAWDVVEQSPNMFVIAGETQSFGAGGKDAWIVRYDAVNDIFDWNKTIGSAATEDYKALTLDPFGGFYAAGRGVQNGRTDEDVMVTRFDELGDTVWNNYYGDTLQDYANDIILKTNDQLSITGLTTLPDSTGCILLSNIDTLGATSVTDTWGISSHILKSFGVKIMEIDSQRISVLGNYTYGIDNSEFAFGYSFPFGLYYERGSTLGSQENDVATAAVVNANYGYSFVGYTNGFQSSFNNILMYKTNRYGVTDHLSDFLHNEDTLNITGIKPQVNTCITIINSAKFSGVKFNCQFISPLTFRLYNQLGLLILTGSISNESPLNINNLFIPHGIYILHLESSSCSDQHSILLTKF